MTKSAGTTTKTITVDRIDADPDQPRQHFDQAELANLADSMRELGQLQAITVRYRPLDRRYTIVAGERRWRAAQLANIETLHAIVLHIDEADALPRAVAENLSRADMTPMEEAQAFQRLVDAGYEIPKIAAMVGKSREYVGYRIDLLNLVGSVAGALNNGHITVGTAWYVAKLSPAAQQVFLRKHLNGDFQASRDADAYARAVRQQEECEQGSLFAAQELSDEQRAAVEARRRKVTRQADRLAPAGEVLAEFAAADPGELAFALAALPGGVSAFLMRVEHLAAAAGKAASVLRLAKAIAAAATPETLTAPADAAPLPLDA